MPKKIKISKKDREWLEAQYGDEWADRIAQHVHYEVVERKMRSGWEFNGGNYATTRSSKQSTKSGER